MPRVNLVYKITIHETDEFYIGIHQTNNIYDGYMGSGGNKFQNAINHALENNFKIKREILFKFKTLEESVNKEKELVTYDLLSDKRCLNSAIGGGGLNTLGMVRVKHLDTLIMVTKDVFNSGDYESWNKDMTTAINISNNKTEYVSVNDDRWKSGEIVGITKNLIPIYNKETGQHKRIDESDITKYKDWVIGLPPKPDDYVTHSKGKTWLHNPTTKERIMCYNDEIDFYINKGFILGIGNHGEARQKSLTSTKGKKWMNNGADKPIMVDKDKVEKYLNMGWQLGRYK